MSSIAVVLTYTIVVCGLDVQISEIALEVLAYLSWKEKEEDLVDQHGHFIMTKTVTCWNLALRL